MWGLGAVRAAETCGPTGTPWCHFGGTKVPRTLLGLKEDSWKGGLLFFSFPFPPFFEIFSNLNDSPSLFRAVVQWVTVVAGGRLEQMTLEGFSNLSGSVVKSALPRYQELLATKPTLVGCRNTVLVLDKCKAEAFIKNK